MAIPIRCISLTRSISRRAMFKAHMDRLGLDFAFFDAVDGHTLSDADIAQLGVAVRRKFFTHELTRCEIGTFLSHWRIYETIAREQTPLTVVMEDDGEAAPDFAELLEAIAALPQFDLVWLCGGPKGRRYKSERRLTQRFDLVRPFETKSTAQAYVVSLAGAQKLATYCARLTDPIDIVVKRYWAFGGNVFNVMPSACQDFANLGPSTIDDRPPARPRSDAGLTAMGALRHNVDELRKVGSFAFRVLNVAPEQGNAG